MHLLCLFNVHKYVGCECIRCHKTRNLDHDWSENCNKCLRCGMQREDEHDWKGCTCSKCGVKRNEQHDWSDNCIKCSRCGMQREDEHDWKGCTCSKCGVKRNEQHDWSHDCRVCSRCNIYRKADHVWSGNNCIHCKMTRKKHIASEKGKLFIDQKIAILQAQKKNEVTNSSSSLFGCDIKCEKCQTVIVKIKKDIFSMRDYFVSSSSFFSSSLKDIDTGNHYDIRHVINGYLLKIYPIESAAISIPYLVCANCINKIEAEPWEDEMLSEDEIYIRHNQLLDFIHKAKENEPTIICSKCGSKYNVGIDAIAVTLDDALSLGSKTLVLGELPSMPILVSRANESTSHREILESKIKILKFGKSIGWCCAECGMKHINKIQ